MHPVSHQPGRAGAESKLDPPHQICESGAIRSLAGLRAVRFGDGRSARAKNGRMTCGRRSWRLLLTVALVNGVCDDVSGGGRHGVKDAMLTDPQAYGKHTALSQSTVAADSSRRAWISLTSILLMVRPRFSCIILPSTAGDKPQRGRFHFVSGGT